MSYFPIGSAIGFNRPASLITKCFKDFIIIAVLRKLIVSVHPQTGENIRRYSSSPPFPPFIVLPLLPRRQSRPRSHDRSFTQYISTNTARACWRFFHVSRSIKILLPLPPLNVRPNMHVVRSLARALCDSTLHEITRRGVWVGRRLPKVPFL